MHFLETKKNIYIIIIIIIAACPANCSEDSHQSQATQTCFVIWNNITQYHYESWDFHIKINQAQSLWWFLDGMCTVNSILLRFIHASTENSID